jgi:hypothetical protein
MKRRSIREIAERRQFLLHFMQHAAIKGKGLRSKDYEMWYMKLVNFEEEVKQYENDEILKATERARENRGMAREVRGTVPG